MNEGAFLIFMLFNAGIAIAAGIIDSFINRYK